MHIIDKYFGLSRDYLHSIRETSDAAPDDGEVIRHATQGALKLIDAIYVHEHVQATRPRRILEVGSFLGFSTRWLLEASSDWEANVLSVDPGLRHRIFDRPRTHLRKFCSGFSGRLDIIDACLSEKNEAMFMHDYLYYKPQLSPREALARMDEVAVLTEPFGVFDFAFIDGDHSFAATIANVRLVASMMPDGGTILVHDAISWPDVGGALQAICAEMPALTFDCINGLDYHLGADNLAWSIDRDPAVLKAPLCDGLGVVLVAATPATPLQSRTGQASGL